ncbi:VWA domain-containing protein [Tissierella creatinini]|nr:VWA domain-containing protein [Tissierella creatinini]TJX61516.1 VWA domain-containing protein [Soehngenia saccharolytica]
MRKLIILLLILSFSISTYAAPLSDLNSETLAVSLVIDTSGSMAQTDPQKLRQAVADVFIDYLNPEDYLGIITFNSAVDLEIPMQQLKDDTIRSSIKSNLGPKLEGIADTDYKAALDKANLQLESLFNPDATKIIIFLTDGKPDPNPIKIPAGSQAMNKYMNGLWGTVASISTNKYPVYSIGFSDGIDVEVLNRIATETGGDVRIYKDAADLDTNLVKMLKSREKIVEELLAPQEVTSEVGVNVKPALVSDFWLKNEGYRKGEKAVISASLLAGNTRIHSGKDLIVESFQLMIEQEDGNKLNIPLYDDGLAEHSDIRANDGLWSNMISFDKNGKANAKLMMKGKLKGQEISLEKDIGEYLVEEPGNISLTSYDKKVWVKKGDILKIPLRLKNDSTFRETLFIQVDEGFGKVLTNQIDLEANSDKDYELDIELNPNLDKKVYNSSISLNPRDVNTTIDKSTIEYDVELVGSFESIRRNFAENSSLLLPLVGIFIGLPLLAFVLGLLFYITLLKPQLNVRGTLVCWEEANTENRTELDLSTLKKNKIIITLDDNKTADFKLSSSRYDYDIELYKDLVKKSSKFILGWKVLLSKKAITELIVKTTQPGIIEHEGDIFTKMSLYDEDEFISGEYSFKYIKPKTMRSKETDEGRNVLEGRV